jgi:hypothetical protein
VLQSLNPRPAKRRRRGEDAAAEEMEGVARRPQIDDLDMPADEFDAAVDAAQRRVDEMYASRDPFEDKHVGIAFVPELRGETRWMERIAQHLSSVGIGILPAQVKNTIKELSERKTIGEAEQALMNYAHGNIYMHKQLLEMVDAYRQRLDRGDQDQNEVVVSCMEALNYEFGDDRPKVTGVRLSLKHPNRPQMFKNKRKRGVKLVFANKYHTDEMTREFYDADELHEQAGDPLLKANASLTLSARELHHADMRAYPLVADEELPFHYGIDLLANKDKRALKFCEVKLPE